MELHWPHVNSGKHGAAGEGFPIDNSRTVTQILERNSEDEFECTYFRRRPNKTPMTAKKGPTIFPLTTSYTSTSELSERYTDSDSESDNTSNVERWLESLPTNDAWSSAPNYSALDGSKGLEGVDEIQEDSKKITDDEDSGTCGNSTDDSRKSINCENVTATGDELAKRTFARRDEISMAMAEWLNQQASGKKIRRALRTRKKIPTWTKVERDGINLVGKDKAVVDLVVKSTTPLRKLVGIQEGNISAEKKVSWSNSDAFGGSYISGNVKMTGKSSLEKAGRDDTMQEMVDRLLTVSTRYEDEFVDDKKFESSFKTTVKDLEKYCGSTEPKETDDDSLLRVVESKRETSSTTFKKLSPKSAKTRISGNQLSKRTRFVQKTSTIKSQSQNPKRPRRIAQGKKTCNVRSNSVLKTRRVVKNQSPVMGKKVRYSESPRTVRFEDETAMQTPSETWRRTARVKIARNKKILQSVEQIVGDIKNGESDSKERNMKSEFCEVKKVPSIASSNKLQPYDGIKFRKIGSWKSNRKRTMFPTESKTFEKRKPIFANPMIENCLNKSMELALKKYKFPQNTWEDFIRDRVRENVTSVVYEPPAKKQKPKSFIPKLENVQRTQDFSILNSWQSFHKHVSLDSACK